MASVLIKGDVTKMTREVLKEDETARPIEIKTRIFARHGKQAELGAIKSARDRYFQDLGRTPPPISHSERHKPPRPEFSSNGDPVGVRTLGRGKPPKKDYGLPKGLIITEAIRQQLMLDENASGEEINVALQEKYGCPRIPSSIISTVRKNYFLSIGKEPPKFRRGVGHPFPSRMSIPRMPSVMNGSSNIEAIKNFLDSVQNVGGVETARQLLNLL